MLIFIFFYILIFILSFKIKKEKFTIFDVILIFLLIMFSGLRGVGIDYELYGKIYNSPFQLESRTGIGFTYLMYLYKYILHLDYQALIFTVSIITILCIYYFIKKNSERPGLSILIYVSLGFYTTSFNMFRQSLSIALVLVASHLYNNKKIFKSILLYCCGFLVHSSSIIAIVAYSIIKKFNNKKIKFKYILPFSILGLLLFDKLFMIFINTFDSYSMYSTYNAVPGLGTYINVTLYLLFTVFLLIPRYKNVNNDDYQYYNLFLIGICIMMLEYKNYLFFRIAFYFIIFSVFMLSNFYIEHKLQNRKFESLLFYLCLFVYFIIYICSFDGVLPYKMFFM